MDASAAHEHHQLDYVELGALDVAVAKRFYAAAFGWRFNDYGEGYAGICGAAREVGGLRKVDAIRAGGPLVILYSRELESSLAAVVAAGGTIATAPFAFPGGRRFHFHDPSGNELAVWSER